MSAIKVDEVVIRHKMLSLHHYELKMVKEEIYGLVANNGV